MDLFSLQDLVRNFGSAIAAVPPGERPVGLKWYPRGACMDSSLLLGAYLRDAGYHGFELMCTSRGTIGHGTYQTHAWLQRGKLVVDLTAGQFPDAPSDVVVADPSPWHESFAVVTIGPADFREDRGPALEGFAQLYERICAHLKKSLAPSHGSADGGSKDSV